VPLAYSGEQLREGVPCEDVIKDCLTRAQKAYEEIPVDPQERPIWDWNRIRQQIEAMVYGYIAKYHEDQPRIVETLPDSMLKKWRAIEQSGGTPCFQKRRYWGVEDEGPADPLPVMEAPPEEPESDGEPKLRFRLIKFQDMRPGLEPAYLVDELMPSAGLVLVWGKQKTFKSFWLLDLFVHVAMGWPYRDHAVRQGAVIYCAFEGGHGYKGRIEAIRRHYGIANDMDVPLYVMPGQVDLIADEKALVEEFATSPTPSFPRSWFWTPSTAASRARRAATRT
jgi:AAA domain